MKQIDQNAACNNTIKYNHLSKRLKIMKPCNVDNKQNNSVSTIPCNPYENRPIKKD